MAMRPLSTASSATCPILINEGTSSTIPAKLTAIAVGMIFAVLTLGCFSGAIRLKRCIGKRKVRS